MSGFDTFLSRLIVQGELEMLAPVRVGTGQANDAAEPDLPVMKDALDRPLIPGSSLKGALRSHVESVLRAMSQHVGAVELACDVLADEACISDERVKAIIADGDLKPVERDEALIAESCWTCRLFGAPWMAAKASFRDLPVIPAYWGERYLIRDGVAIDRDTGTARQGMKYDFEAVPAGARFSFAMQVDNATDAELGLALLAVRALEQEQVQIGGARSRGLGWCKLHVEKCVLHTDPVAYLLGKEGEALSKKRQDKFGQAFIEEVRGDA